MRRLARRSPQRAKAGAYVDFSEIAIPGLAALLSGEDALRGSPHEMAEHVVESMGSLTCIPMSPVGCGSFTRPG
jgi:hypothetical protein